MTNLVCYYCLRGTSMPDNGGLSRGALWWEGASNSFIIPRFVSSVCSAFFKEQDHSSLLNSVKHIRCTAQWIRQHIKQTTMCQVAAFNEHCTLYVKLWPYCLSTCAQSNVLGFGCNIPMYIVYIALIWKNVLVQINLIWFEMYHLPLLHVCHYRCATGSCWNSSLASKPFHFGIPFRNL